MIVLLCTVGVTSCRSAKAGLGSLWSGGSREGLENGEGTELKGDWSPEGLETYRGIQEVAAEDLDEFCGRGDRIVVVNFYADW
ncbi:MAG: hypothetical protein AAGC74_06195 [Verrucomicrobiota bacterium]